MNPKYYFEIDVSGYECRRFQERCWACYGMLVAEGNTLQELLDSAGVDILDQDGGTLDCGPIEEEWMQELIVEAFNEKTMASAER